MSTGALLIICEFCLLFHVKLEVGAEGAQGCAHLGQVCLGLYLCRRVCDKLGHSLRFESELGRGTRAVIGFPDCRLDVE